MRIPRIYHSTDIAMSPFSLSADAANHVARVLRMNAGDQLVLFNGDGCEYTAEIVQISKKQVDVQPLSQRVVDVESPLSIHLGQVISRGDRMDFTLQKSVELGVSEITPLFSERCGVKLPPERWEKKIQQWQKIVIGACEQSGRNVVPQVNQPMQLNAWCEQQSEQLKLTLHPAAKLGLKDLQPTEAGVRLLIGPEGGFTDEEVAVTQAQAFHEIAIGPRVLRTETASLGVIAALQYQFGDFK